MQVCRHRQSSPHDKRACAGLQASQQPQACSLLKQTCLLSAGHQHPTRQVTLGGHRMGHTKRLLPMEAQ